jgi:two-component system cell cycle response regulator
VSAGSVLVVDDVADVRHLVRLALESNGHDVFEAAHGDEALAVLSRVDVDLVLLDADLPVRDGWSVLEVVRDDPRWSELPVVFLSAQDAPDQVVRALRLGANDHIAKPFHTDELRARVAAAVRIKRLQDDLRTRNRVLAEESRTDALTGLPNRRALDEELARVASAALRHGHAYVVGVLDIDHFKAVNDTWGHEAGDAVLVAIADVLRETLRTEDVVGRWGGEEFVVVLPMTPLDGALVVIDRLRAEVSTRPLAIDGGEQIRVTMSAGCAAGTGAVAAALRLADDALYRAKLTGRDRTAT